MSASPLDLIEARLDERGLLVARRGDKITARCPAHDDDHPSLSVDPGHDGRALVHCFAGYPTTDVVDALALELADLFPDDGGKPWTTAGMRRVGATIDRDGRATLGNVRYLPDPPNGTPKSLAAAGGERDLWPDPASVTGETLFVVEGEPDAVTGASLDIPTVGVPGTGKWDPAWAPRLAHGRSRVVVVADADDSGRKAAERTAKAIAGHCSDVRVLDLAPERSDGYDLSDFAADAQDEDGRKKLAALITRAGATAHRVPRAPRPGGLTIRRADLSRSTPPRWAWQDRIVSGYLNLLLGNEGIGKGATFAWIAAQLTKGELEGDYQGTPISVAIIGDEDSFDSVWTPRLHAAEADLDRIVQIERPDGGYIDLARDRRKLEEAIKDAGIGLVYLDQLLDNLATGTEINGQKGVRDALQPMRVLAREVVLPVLGSLHPNKRAETFRELVAGTVAFNAVSRSSLLLAEHPDQDGRRVIARGKGNLSEAPAALEFEIESHCFTANGHEFDVPRVCSFTESGLTVDDLLNPADPGSPASEDRQTARKLIAAALEDGEWHEAKVILQKCAEEGINTRMAQRAGLDVGIEKKRTKDAPPKSLWRKRRKKVATGRRAPVGAVATVATVVSNESGGSAAKNPAKPGHDSDDRHDSGDKGIGAVVTGTEPLDLSASGDPDGAVEPTGDGPLAELAVERYLGAE